MKIALVSPKSHFLSRSPGFQEFWRNSPYTRTYRDQWSGLGSGLLVLASLCSPSAEVTLIDENREPIDFDEPFDLVGITAMTQQAVRAYEIADEFRRQGRTVVLGGIHVSVMHGEALQHADSVVVGEGEYLWPLLLDDVQNGKLKPVYKAEDTVDLTDSPLPRYDLLQGKDYKIAWLQGSRGCPHDCEFCAASKVFGRKFRYKGIDQILREVEHIRNVPGDIRIGFSDDNLFANKKYIKRLLKALIPLKIRWISSGADISIAEDKELLDLMYESGCLFVLVGLESTGEESLRNLDSRNWKYRKLKHYPEYIDRIQAHGIGVFGSFIIGLPDDGPGVFDEVSDFIIENRLYGAQITICTPFPGTRLHDRLKGEGRLLDTSWDNYTLQDVNFRHPHLTREELETGLLSIYKRIYSEDVYFKKVKHFTELALKRRKELYDIKQ